MNKYVIMGAQGCGKGTQAKMLTRDFDWVYICIGDIFRWNIQAHTKLAAQVKRIIAEGKLVSDEIVEEVIRSRLQEHDWNYGFVLDGFPRNHSQATFLLENYDIDAVIHIEIPDEVVFERVLSRRLCSGCGLDYNLISHRPARDNICDVCGGQLVSRPDDNRQALAERLRAYHAQTEPVIEIFADKGLSWVSTARRRRTRCKMTFARLCSYRHSQSKKRPWPRRRVDPCRSFCRGAGACFRPRRRVKPHPLPPPARRGNSAIAAVTCSGDGTVPHASPERCPNPGGAAAFRPGALWPAPFGRVAQTGKL